MIFLVAGIADSLLPLPHAKSQSGRLQWLGLRWNALLAAAIGLTGATTLSEIGTTFGDILSADAVLLGLFAALKQWPNAWRASAAMGLGLGCATGLN